MTTLGVARGACALALLCAATALSVSGASATVLTLTADGKYVEVDAAGAAIAASIAPPIAAIQTVTESPPTIASNPIAVTTETMPDPALDANNALDVVSTQALRDGTVVGVFDPAQALRDAAAIAERGGGGGPEIAIDPKSDDSAAMAVPAAETMPVADQSPDYAILPATPVAARVVGQDAVLTVTPDDPAESSADTPTDWVAVLAGSGALAHLDLLKVEAALHAEVDMALLVAVIETESAFNTQAVSNKGAMGLMQLMPATAERYGVVNPFMPEQNVAAGAAELARLMSLYRNPALALAAYNAGEAAVAQYDGVPPFAETQGYIVKVLTRAFALRDLATRPPLPAAQAEAAEVEDDPRFSPLVVQSFDYPEDE